MTNLEQAAAAAIAAWERDGARYDTFCQRMDALRDALAAHRQAEPVVEPSYFGLTKDHTWLSVSKEEYDKLKPQGRMACVIRREE